MVSGILGLNDGYVSDGHNGANFYALSVGLERNITDDFVISCHGMQSFAIDRDLNLDGDRTIGRFFPFRFRLSMDFLRNLYLLVW